MRKETQIKTRTLYRSILPRNSLGRYAQKSKRSTVRGIVKEWEKGAFEGVEAETGGGEKVSTKIQLK